MLRGKFRGARVSADRAVSNFDSHSEKRALRIWRLALPRHIRACSLHLGSRIYVEQFLLSGIRQTTFRIAAER